MWIILWHTGRVQIFVLDGWLFPLATSNFDLNAWSMSRKMGTYNSEISRICASQEARSLINFGKMAKPSAVSHYVATFQLLARELLRYILSQTKKNNPTIVKVL